MHSARIKDLPDFQVDRIMSCPKPTKCRYVKDFLTLEASPTLSNPHTINTVWYK